MAETAITVALEQLRDLLYVDGKLLPRAAGEVKELENLLVELKCLIKDADNRRYESKPVKIFNAEIRDLADRVEVVIPLYADRVSSNKRRGVKKVLRRYACILIELQSLHQIESEISAIRFDIVRLIKQMQDYGIINKIFDGEESSYGKARITYPHFEMGDFVGMEKELKQLVSLIEGEEHPIITVWGMGGLGKTTIARKVYNQMKNPPEPASCFDRFAWVCISQQFQIRLVLEGVLRQLDPQTEEDASSLSEDDLIRRLYEIQIARRCLIVIDDLWNISDWDKFKHAFRAQGLKSKVLVTTRKQDVAVTIGFSLKHGNLNMNEAWELLKKKAFPNNIPEHHSQEKLQEIGKIMLGKCGCLPLAICVLGGVLRQKSMRDWEYVNENLDEYMSKVEGDDEDRYGIRGVLDLSYEDLPYYLKPCFLYLGTLQENESIKVLDLYRLWIAQAMILSKTHEGENGSLMGIAEIYLSELVSSCIVEVEVEDIIPAQKYRSCKLHNVVRVQCLLKGRNEGFGVKILNLPGGGHGTSLLRYLVIHIASGEVEQGVNELAKEDTNKLQVKSLKLVANDEEKVEFPAQSIVDFQRFKMLRDLVIYRFKFPRRKFPSGITDLVHLGCLRLLQCELDELPSSLSKLVYLETLDLQYSRNVRIPNVLKKMLRLKHLILPYYFEHDNGSYRLRLDEGLDELETLEMFEMFDSTMHELKDITRMKNLRRLSAVVYDNKSLSVIINALDTNWNKLQFSAVSIADGCQLTSEEGWMILKQIFRCRNLHSLGIYANLGKLPEESMNNSKLAVLCLSHCKLEDDPMGILGMLPVLGQLDLSIQSFVGEELRCTASSFPRLKKLYLGFLQKLRQWRVEAGAMPLLSELCMASCRRLEKIPDGLSSISTLQKLEIRFMRELAKRVAPSGEDFRKIDHIPSITIYKSPPTQVSELGVA